MKRFVNPSKSMKAALFVFGAIGCMALLPILTSQYIAPSAEATNALPDKVGKWQHRSIYSDEKSYRLTKLERDIYMKKLQRIEDVFKQVKMLNPPMGVEVRPALYILWIYEGKNHEKMPISQLPVMGKFSLFVFEYLDIPEQHKTIVASEGCTQDIYINAINSVIAGSASLSETCEPWKFMRSEGTIYSVPKYGGERQGFPVYNKMIVITNNPKPLWLQLSREEFLRDRLCQEAGPHALGNARQLKEELDSLSPEGRESPAYIANIPESDPRHRASGMGDPGDPGARAVVRINPDFFDKSLPRTAFQLITVSDEIDTGSFTFHGLDYRRIEELRQAIDLKKLADLLDRPHK